jgi:hypothetical protein
MKKNGIWASVSLGVVLFPLSCIAAAEDLVIVRPKTEFVGGGLDRNLRDRIARGNVFHFGAPLIPGRGYGSYETVVVYPQSYTNNRQEPEYRGSYPVTPSGWISVKVDPADAEVLVDGHPLKVDPSSGLSQKKGYLVGRHTIEARKKGMEPYSGEVEIRQATELHIDVQLSQ